MGCLYSEKNDPLLACLFRKAVLPIMRCLDVEGGMHDTFDLTAIDDVAKEIAANCAFFRQLRWIYSAMEVYTQQHGIKEASANVWKEVCGYVLLSHTSLLATLFLSPVH